MPDDERLCESSNDDRKAGFMQALGDPDAEVACAFEEN